MSAKNEKYRIIEKRGGQVVRVHSVHVTEDAALKDYGLLVGVYGEVAPGASPFTELILTVNEDVVKYTRVITPVF